MASLKLSNTTLAELQKYVTIEPRSIDDYAWLQTDNIHLKFLKF